MNYETEYTLAALDALEPWLFLLPSDVQRKIRLARTIIESHGGATAEEMRAELGANWVLARRTRRIIEKYARLSPSHSTEEKSGDESSDESADNGGSPCR